VTDSTRWNAIANCAGYFKLNLSHHLATGRRLSDSVLFNELMTVAYISISKVTTKIAKITNLTIFKAAPGRLIWSSD